MANPTIHFEEALGSAVTDKRIEVLRAVQQVGSISEAARACGLSYKAAWQAVETLSNLAGVTVIEKVVGGSGGGGAELTKEGLALAKISRKGQPSGLSLAGVSGLGLKTSMRNHLPCTVVGIKRSQGVARVFLALAGGRVLVARITYESLQLLGLRTGMRVVALCKATAVVVAPKIVVAGSVNLFEGRVMRLAGTKEASEASVQIGPGLQLVGFTEADSGLKRNQPAMAAVEESAVVIGLLG
jgi:molybdate transport system regulatory protein